MLEYFATLWNSPFLAPPLPPNSAWEVFPLNVGNVGDFCQVTEIVNWTQEEEYRLINCFMISADADATQYLPSQILLS